MARRSDHSRDELYRLAIDAARDIVEADGFRALTARNVADVIGYSPGTLYNLFVNQDDMVMHVNGRTLDDLHDSLASVMPTGDVDADFALLLDTYLVFIKDNPGLWHMLFNYTLSEGHEIPEWYGRKVKGLLGIVESVLSPLFANNDGDKLSAESRVLWAGLHGITALSDTGKLSLVSGQSTREMAQMLVANYIAGIRARQSVRK
ncbi:MAG: hypothetical protein COV67_06120 [Nitrospinae bacterium CG11_big_fil_rev_8_21_14_0_20_56_8]|nr:MAG: hypothetical protein COV67_06120 [Nitrospinae bacterium CG11_big_fil_rev_8_21_14_0_20_56_8]